MTRLYDPRVRILLTEDEPEMAQLISQGLAEDGYDVDVVRSGERAIDSLAETRYDLVLLDVMLPRLDGFATCRRMRQWGASMPVLMLTARDGVDDRVHGLDAGADDYLTKPFSLDELLARVRALLRRGAGEFGARIAVGDLAVDTAALAAWRNGQRADLTPRECAVLELLLRRHGRIVTRDQILEAAWPPDVDHRSNVLEVVIKRIREKIDKPFEARSIETVRGLGYRLRVE
jgi:two-component system OmpR family response regulator